MSMTYQNFASLGVNLNRQKYGPLDISNVFTSAADLKYYLTKGTFTEGVSEYWYKNANEKVVPYPYEGQVLATVIDGVVNVYALSLDAEGNFQTQEIGAKIETDDKTIKLVDGKLELVGLPANTAGKTYVPSYVNGVLTWAEPDTSTAEGQQQAIDGLAARAKALEDTVNGVEASEGVEAKEGLVAKVAALEAVDNATQAELDAYKEVVTNAIADALQAAKDYADAQDADTIYDDKALAGRVTTAEGKIADLEAAVEAIDYVDEDELADAIKDFATDSELEAGLALKADKTALEALKDRVDAFLTGEGTEAALDSLQELIAYIDEHDGADLTEMIATIEGIENKLEGIDATVAAYVTAAIEALKIGDYAKAADLTALAGRVEALENKPFDTYATKTEVQGVDAKFDNYTTSTDLEATYATKSALTEAVEGIENDLLVYAKTADVTAELAKKIDGGTIVHSSEAKAEGVTVNGTKLDIVVDTYTKQEVRDYVADVIEDMTGGESAADVLLALNNHIDTYTEKVGQIDAKNEAQDTAIAAAKTQADKGVSDAAAVAADLATANGLIADNTREIGVVKSSIQTVNETLTGKITALENADTKFTSDIAALQGTVSGDGGHTSRIIALETRAANLETRDTELAALIQANTDKFASYYTKTEVDEAVQGAIDAIPDVDFTPYAKTEDVTVALALKANAADVYTKDEADAEFMTEGEVDARINALIVAADPEGGKTITDIQNLVKYVDENAGEIAALVTTVGEHTTTIGQHTTAIADINAAIAAIVQPKASAEVTVAEDGTLGLGEVSTDKLVMGAKTLVLDGGSSK